ncbi:hypothetical protein BT93_F1752 [Corymbia citriodora subsp. variegata]|nr:hypothetical protein BT93_F1752 [Corymbia citriodora subsp. variegata]
MEKGPSRRIRVLKRKSADIESTEGVSTPLSVPRMPIGAGSDQYDVFLSFRGLDTRKGFADHLYRNLVNVGTLPISVFRDNNSLKIGEDFDSKILDAITQSKISIPIISENYASSKWCLHELVRIMDCKKSMSHTVMPIFYKVDPSDVRYLKGNFGKAFYSREKRFDEKDIQQWKQALTEVSYLNGWESEKFAKGHEGELVEEVIKTISSKLRHNFHLDIPKHLVGVDDHVNKIKNWVGTPTSHARMIGIYGMGGIGKTTLAKVIYNELLNEFVHCSFLPDIRETADRNSIPYLQNLLINEILPNEDQVRKIDAGINVIKSRFKGKKVLILLDDIDHEDQLNALARERDWFRTGSIIIVTTRNKAVLDQSKFQVEYECELNGLDEVHSLILFKRHAFRMGHCSKDFERVSQDILSTMGGLPLAIKVIGSYLYGKTNVKVWQDILTKLRNQPDKNVQKILKISYDALELGHQEIFLDIACFFISKKSRYAIYMWEECEFYPNQGIEELKLRCLIKIEANGKFGMHDQLRDLGRSIICQEQSLERRSRLWKSDEAFKVLKEEKGTKDIHAMRLSGYSGLADRTYTNKQFNNFRSLRFLILEGVVLSGDFNNLFSELRWLNWSHHLELEPSDSTINLHLPKLVVMQMYNSSITEDWGGWSSIMTAERLKVLNFTNCELRRTPNLSAFVELEILILRNCSELKHVDPSIGKLRALVYLDLRSCWKLEELPREVGELKKLKELRLEYSPIITEIPKSIGSMRELEKLTVRCCTSLKGIPNSIGDLQSLQHLSIQGSSPVAVYPSAIGRLKKLQSLCLKCHEGEIPREISELSSLHSLSLSGSTRIVGLQTSPGLPQLSRLIQLKELDLICFEDLEDIPKLPSGLSRLVVRSCPKVISLELTELKYLVELSIQVCNSIQKLDLSQLNHLERLQVAYCDKLVKIQGHDDWKSLKKMVINECGSIQKLFLPKWLKELKVEICNNLTEIKVHDDPESLEKISISLCKSIPMLILPRLQRLKQLEVRNCYNLFEIQNLDKAEFLEALSILGCESIISLPNLPCTLKEIEIANCRSLRGLESLERFLSCRSISIHNCTVLTKLPNLLKFENLEHLAIIDCLGLTEILGIGELRSLTRIVIARCISLKTLPDLSACEKLQYLMIASCEKITQLQGLEKLNLIELEIYGCNLLKIPELPRTHVMRYGGGRYICMTESDCDDDENISFGKLNAQTFRHLRKAKRRR